MKPPYRVAYAGLFLADSENQVGRLIWDLLAEPLSQAEALALISQACPQISPEIIRNDLENFWDELERNGLIRPA